MTRDLKLDRSYLANDYYVFDATATVLPYLTAAGSGPAYAYHKSKSVMSLPLLATGLKAPSTCVCGHAPPAFGHTADGTITYTDPTHKTVPQTLGFGKSCVPSNYSQTERGQLVDERNPTCDVRAYNGGLRCCHHLWYLLDKDQKLPAAIDTPFTYHMKMRFYFQEYKPDVHQELWRWHFATELGSGEYDIPRCSKTAAIGKNNYTGDLVGQNNTECVHTLTAHVQVKDFISHAPCDYRSGLNVLSSRCPVENPNATSAAAVSGVCSSASFFPQNTAGLQNYYLNLYTPGFDPTKLPYKNTLADAQAWCCAQNSKHGAGFCAGITLQDGIHTPRSNPEPIPFAGSAGLATWTLKPFTPQPPPKKTVGFKPILLGGHCHAPTCLSMELWNADTGELICRNLPTYGTMHSNTTGAHRFEEEGYLALPPCVWGRNSQGLHEAPLLTWDTNLTAIKRTNSTYGHTGEMALWQGRGVVV